MVNAAVTTTTFSTQGYPTPGQKVPWSEVFSIPQFNAAAGVELTRIDFQLDAAGRILASGVNTTGAPATFGYTSGGTVLLFVPEGPPQAIYVFFPSTGNFVADPGPFSFTGPEKSGTASFALTGIGNPSFAPYLGTGTVSAQIFGEENGPDGLFEGPFLSGPTGLLPGPDTYSAARLTVTYTYQAVPEAGTLGLLSCGLLLLSVRICRR